jgi:hypothetical protein
MSQSTYSKKSTLEEFNNGSSMIEKHTIIFESEFENVDNHSQAPTESQHLQHKQTIYLDDNSSMANGSTPINKNDTLKRVSSKVDSERPPEFNTYGNSKNLATFRDNRHNSQSDIYYNDVDLDECYDDHRVAKTALAHSRAEVNGSKITVGRVEAVKDEPHVSDSTPKAAIKPQYSDANIQVQLGDFELTASEKQKLNDEIYLNTNSVEANPDKGDECIRDSASVSKHTLVVNTHTDYSVKEVDSFNSDKEVEENNLVEECESGMSQKEFIQKFDKNIQISPDSAPLIDKTFQVSRSSKEEPIRNKGMQTSTNNAPEILNKDLRKDEVKTKQSEFINKVKLENKHNTQERFMSDKDIVEYQSQNSESKQYFFL